MPPRVHVQSSEMESKAKNAAIQPSPPASEVGVSISSTSAMSRPRFSSIISNSARVGELGGTGTVMKAGQAEGGLALMLASLEDSPVLPTRSTGVQDQPTASNSETLRSERLASESTPIAASSSSSTDSKKKPEKVRLKLNQNDSDVTSIDWTSFDKRTDGTKWVKITNIDGHYYLLKEGIPNFLPLPKKLPRRTSTNVSNVSSSSSPNTETKAPSSSSTLAKRQIDASVGSATSVPTFVKKARTVVDSNGASSSAPQSSAVSAATSNQSLAAPAKGKIIPLGSSKFTFVLESTEFDYMPSSAGVEKPQWVIDHSKSLNMVSADEHVGHKIPKSFINGFYLTCQEAKKHTRCPLELKTTIGKLPDQDNFAFMDVNLQREKGNPGYSEDAKTPDEQLEFHGPQTPRRRYLAPIYDMLKSPRKLTFAEIKDILQKIKDAELLGYDWSDNR